MPHFPKPWFRKPRNTWYVEIDGRQHNLGPDKDEAFKRYHELMRREQPREVDCTLVVGVLDAFLNWAKNNKKDRTFEWYQRHLQVFARSVPPLLSVGQLKKHHLTACVEALADWSSTTKNGLCRAVVRAFQWAEDEEHISRSPLGRFKKPKSKRREVVIPEADFEAMVEFFPSQPIKDLLTFAWEVGPRPQELVAVAARHVDVATERVVFPAGESKGGKLPRVIYLTPRALEIVSRLSAAHPEGPVFRNTDGEPWTRQSLACLFGRLRVAQGLKALKAEGAGPPPLPRFKRHKFSDEEQLAAARVEQRARIYERRKELDRLARKRGRKYSLYHFRHTWATRALRRGVDPLTVAILLGHSDPSTLAKVYAHLAHDPEYLRKSIRRATASGDGA